MADRCTDAGDFRVGRVVTRDYLFTRERIVAYAEMAGDNNPLHHDEAVASRSRFGKLIACAAHSTGVLTSLLASSFSQDGRAVGLGFEFMLRRAVAVDTDAVLMWRIDSVEDSLKPRGRVISLSGEIRDRDGLERYLAAQGRMLILDNGVYATRAGSGGEQSDRRQSKVAKVK